MTTITRGFSKSKSNRELQAAGHQCPDCGAGYAHIEDNGQKGRGLAFICTDCGWQWDAADIDV